MKQSPLTRRHQWYCAACRKATFVRRKDARRAARVYHPDDSNLSAYECPDSPGRWHYGHLKPGDRDRNRLPLENPDAHSA